MKEGKLYRMIFDIDKMIVSAVVGGLILLVGGVVVFVSILENQIPTLGTYIMLIGIIIVVIGPLGITIFENIKKTDRK